MRHYFQISALHVSFVRLVIVFYAAPINTNVFLHHSHYSKCFAGNCIPSDPTRASTGVGPRQPGTTVGLDLTPPPLPIFIEFAFIK